MNAFIATLRPSRRLLAKRVYIRAFEAAIQASRHWGGLGSETIRCASAARDAQKAVRQWEAAVFG